MKRKKIRRIMLLILTMTKSAEISVAADIHF